MFYARDEKVRILQWLLPQLHDHEIVAAELPFKSVSRKADIAVLSPSRLYAIEIKGYRDNLGSLLAQLDDYQSSFLEVSVAAASRYIPTLRDIVPRRVGLIELGRDGVHQLRKPTSRNALKAIDAVQWLRVAELKKLLDNRSQARHLEHLREEAVGRLSATKLTDAACKAALARATARYGNFLAERGEQITADDVAVLELPTRVRWR